ncbi:hypothetical protein H6P81_002908 [Aristolochia fimbriata]|uniref:Aminotransferase-like plant mobile domain-containing protein n=1 Tax=Aristolochia fimbriata TaxID=158543 RepID=A0AAV7FB27_ARIFI|nr:hypothetical protein H6P81_002908 [Aristolochia fimbriata]
MNAWFVHRREKAAQITTHLCPSVDAHLRTVVDDARHVYVVVYGDGIFQAGEHKVNVMLKECTCRSFQIYQVSCVPAIVVCGAIHYDFNQMTSEYYYASTNARVYELAFDVPTRRSTWVQEGLVVPLPGQKRTPGRPMSMRIQNSMDWRDDDRGRYLCSICKQPVHNKRACKARLLAVQRVLVRGLGVGNVVMADAPLLYDQDSYRSEAIWHGEDPRCLECTEHFQALRHWPMDEGMLPYIEAAGFSALHRVQLLRLDKPLITALVERWRSETNTFHLANGEMTITLEDVAVLLELRVDGDALTGSTRADCMELARVLLGVELPPGSFQRVDCHYHGSEANFHSIPTTRPSCARGVHMAYLTLFEDFEAARRWNVRRTNATNPGGNLVLYRTELDHLRSFQVKWQSYLDFMQRLHAICVEGRRIWLSRIPLICFEIVELHVPDRVMLQFGLEQVTPVEDVEHVTRISRKGRPGEDWALYHCDYITRQPDTHPRHAPSDYMRWYLGATRRFISPPPTEPAMVYHPRGYTEEALLGCVRNVVERVNHREALDPYLPLLEGAIVGGDVSHAGEPSHVVDPASDRAPRRRRARRRPTAETMTHVEDSDKVPAVSEPTVPDLPPEQTPDPEPDQPLEPPQEQPQEPEPSRHPPIRRIYTRRQKKAIGAPEPSSAL